MRGWKKARSCPSAYGSSSRRTLRTLSNGPSSPRPRPTRTRPSGVLYAWLRNWRSWKQTKQSTSTKGRSRCRNADTRTSITCPDSHHQLREFLWSCATVAIAFNDSVPLPCYRLYSHLYPLTLTKQLNTIVPMPRLHFAHMH